MSNIIDITGQKFNMLTALYLDDSTSANRHKRWICVCDCGNIVSRYSHKLRKGISYSCGCKKRPRQKSSTVPKQKKSYIKFPNDPVRRRLHNTYSSMKKRCYNQNNKSYKYYGAKGITVCEEWLHSFDSFYNWALSNGYEDNLSIDRIDSNKGYSPDNCRWVTMHDQQQNRTDKILITHDGFTLNIKQWCEKLNLKYSQIMCRRQTLIKNNQPITYDNLFRNNDYTLHKQKVTTKDSKTQSKNKRKKPRSVLQCDDFGNIIHIYPSIKDAVESGYSQPGISKSCNKKKGRLHHKGYIWKYAEN